MNYVEKQNYLEHEEKPEKNKYQQYSHDDVKELAHTSKLSKIMNLFIGKFKNTFNNNRCEGAEH